MHFFKVIKKTCLLHWKWWGVLYNLFWLIYFTESCEAAFEEEEFDWAINAAGETKTGQVSDYYEVKPGAS